jgi:hypothetical protein
VAAASLADAARVIQGLFEARIREASLSAGIDLRSSRASLVFRIESTLTQVATVYRVNVFGAFPVDTNTTEE